MVPPPNCGTPITRFVAPQRAPPKVPVAELAWRHRPIFAHPSHVSWPHRELHRRPQWQGPHGATAPFWHTPHTARGPIGSSTEGPSGGVRTRSRPHHDALSMKGTPKFTLIVACLPHLFASLARGTCNCIWLGFSPSYFFVCVSFGVSLFSLLVAGRTPAASSGLLWLAGVPEVGRCQQRVSPTAVALCLSSSWWWPASSPSRRR